MLAGKISLPTYLALWMEVAECRDKRQNKSVLVLYQTRERLPHKLKKR